MMLREPNIPNYKILKCLGEGGMGIVWLAEHYYLPRKVAIKWLLLELSNDPEHKLRFRKEAHILDKLDHPNIIRLYDYYEMGKDHFLIMEYFEGVSLKTYLEQKKFITESEALPLFEQILAAFIYAHQMQIIHRDVKPSNILLDKNTGKVKVLDFGISKMLENDFLRTKTGILLGSPAYMSPEQVKGEKATFASDIYALGVMFYEILTGRLPYSLKTKTEYEILEAVVQQPFPVKPSHISLALYACLQKATQKQSQDRYPSVSAFLEDLPSNRLSPSPLRLATNSFPKVWLGAIIGILLIIWFLIQWFSPAKNKNEQLTTRDVVTHIEKFFYAINMKDSVAIEHLVKPSLVHRYTGSRLAQLGSYELQDSIIIHPADFSSASLITAIVPVRYEHHSQVQKQELKVLFDLNHRQIHSVQTTVLSQTLHPDIPKDRKEISALEAFLKQFYLHADAQNIEGLLSCYDERVVKWFAKENADKHFIRKESEKYVLMVQNEQSRFENLTVEALSGAEYALHYELTYNYAFRKKPTSKQTMHRKVLMKVRKRSSGYKIYWIAFEE